MLDILFGEGQLAVKLVIGLIVVIGLLAAFFYGLRRFGGERLGAGGGRGRQPRLAVIDAAMVDGRRRLVLIRRDNVEHLLIIGGPTDVVVEQNIVRAAGALPREAAPAALPRTAPLGEGSMWPLQPEPAPREPAPREAAPREPAPRPDPPMRLDPPARPEPSIRLEPTMRSEPAPRVEPRPQRQSPPPLPAAEEPMQWSADSELPPPPPSRERRSRSVVDPLAGLAGLAEELARVPAAPEPSSSSNSEEPPRQPLRRVARAQSAPSAPPPTPQAAQAPAADAQFNSSADQNLAEMAQRLEAALRRPAKTDESRPAQDASRAAPRAAPEPEAAESGEYEPAPPAPPPARPAAEPARASRSEAKPARADAKSVPQKSLYDSLEQEMASLLGRPNTKP
jgi:flagellar protein FliO/FliZ